MKSYHYLVVLFVFLFSVNVYADQKQIDVDGKWGDELVRTPAPEHPVVYINNMELFLVQPTIMQSFSKKERKILMKESLNKFDMKLSRGDLFGGLNPMATVWIMARVLNTENKLSLDKINYSRITDSLESGLLTDFDVTAVYQQVKSYSNE